MSLDSRRLFLALSLSLTSLAGLEGCAWVQAQDRWVWEDLFYHPQPEENLTLAPPYRNLVLDNPQDTDILQEYFVPVAHADAFLKFYRPEQIAQMYPELKTLFALKACIDPEERFSNEWYRALKSSRVCE
ncbi:hypothetical protein COW36_16105 [bacterium (Candidatus Blackallbacteria) CG17_big_fil_post_rev_8_21_14_2_50_48_46]|uniref:Uncharacterized protein n=1 Tax=bacterium (Candidatus Blackallbacteria) CG17_big_fil_post_rev_8_21_14_2_50_48_46 TaxID=2014261 RepID=A0A2M7G1V1_9BACT|nr:MAG: hypothetical protein COW64_08560 [bacterium (Candidatus Blackallbacteria) CG18_big_fil_WC_8_21_14_2_50_49_26]PIW15726.1 MAG: hypothetical protein COW36_16105 [bacterium (Candidatus Blackallbacteria) CG17_big_fil_post_rev_8_21_14_2_50_48_46]PIW49228.1 MAG: hypothetical protein COW20_06615 [bacterium (Candidatus Blackallbacteria) CG13_big_fil_rev_8_21_14_2_50_49_14]